MPEEVGIPRFIVIEGLDGCGKSTQAKLLADELTRQGIQTLHTCQPSRAPTGQLARMALKGEVPLENEAMALLFATDRYQHYHTEVAPELARGNHVVCDRYFYSNMAFQGIDPAAMKRIMAYNQGVMSPPAKRPDIVFFLDVPPEECIERILHTRQDISIYETIPKLTATRERYLQVFELLKESDNIITIAAAGASEKEVFNKIWSHLNKKLE